MWSPVLLSAASYASVVFPTPPRCQTLTTLHGVVLCEADAVAEEGLDDDQLGLSSFVDTAAGCTGGPDSIHSEQELLVQTLRNRKKVSDTVDGHPDHPSRGSKVEGPISSSGPAATDAVLEVCLLVHVRIPCE